MVVVRKATHDDLPRILDITKVVVRLLNEEGNYQWNDCYPLEADFLKDLEDEVLWVATVDGQVMGFAAITEDQSPDYADCGWDISIPCIVPHRVAVSPECRNKGIAQRFMSLSEEIARERGYKYVRVDTNKVNARMNSLFLKLDYKYVGEITFKDKEKEVPGMRFTCYEKNILL